MTKLHNRLCRLCVAAAGVVLLNAGPNLGQSVPIPCSAFGHHAYGWRVLAPVMLEINGRPFDPMVGTILAVGSATSSGRLNQLLDRECGNM